MVDKIVGHNFRKISTQTSDIFYSKFCRKFYPKFQTKKSDIILDKVIATILDTFLTNL